MSTLLHIIANCRFLPWKRMGSSWRSQEISAGILHIFIKPFCGYQFVYFQGTSLTNTTRMMRTITGTQKTRRKDER